MPDSPMRARAEAALRLPPLSSGQRDPDFEPRKRCHICGKETDGLAFLFGRWMCRDRVSCYQQWKGNVR